MNKMLFYNEVYTYQKLNENASWNQSKGDSVALLKEETKKNVIDTKQEKGLNLYLFVLVLLNKGFVNQRRNPGSRAFKDYNKNISNNLLNTYTSDLLFSYVVSIMLCCSVLSVKVRDGRLKEV